MLLDFARDCSLLEGESTVKTGRMHESVSTYIPTLTFLSGPALGKEIPLVHRQIILGRGSDCDIVIPDPSISRRHVQISCRKIVKKGDDPKLKVVLRDLGSKNGTLVNYSTANTAVLKPGDKIILGRIILKYDHRDLTEQNFYDEIYRLATTDSLTSLLNKATITRILVEEMASSLRDQRWVSVVLIDIDRFKSLNDIYGHLTGDRILQSVASLLRNKLRRRDKVGRFGGDEFLLILPETDSKGAAQLAERIRSNLEASVRAELGLTDKVTASLGVSSCSAGKVNPDDLLERADAALYRSKSLGRNRTEVWRQSGISENAR